MKSINLQPEIIIAEYENFYLIYDGNNYTIGFENNKIEFTEIPDLEKPNKLSAIFNDNEYDGINKIAEKPQKKQTREENDIILLYEVLKNKTSKDADIIIEELILSISAEYDTSKHDKYSIEIDGYPEEIKQKLTEISEKIDKINKQKITLADAGTKGKIVQAMDNPMLKDGLYYEKTSKTDNGEFYTKHTLIGNIILHGLTLTYDKLNLFDSLTTIKYTNTITKQVVTIEKKPYEAIANKLIKDRLIDSTSQGIESILNKIWVQGVNNIDFITGETDLLKDGFFMDMKNKKVLSNNVFNNLKTTKKDIQEAVNLLDELIRGRGTAVKWDCALFRFMLWSPFAYCLKQLGFTDGLYSMVLWGVTDTNKTGSSVIFSNLYTDKTTTLQKANTQSAIGTRLGENTFPLILDEAKDNLENPNDEEFNKNIVTDMTGRAVKDRTNNNLMVEFPALRLTVRTLNQDIEYKDEFLKRHKVLYYDSSMRVTDDEKIKFNKKFKPNAPNTPLKQLQHIGKAFYDRFKPYLEKQSDELYDLEELVIKIIKQIENDYGVSFNTQFKMKTQITAQSTDTGSIIKSGLNKLFYKNYKPAYRVDNFQEIDFINAVNNGAISWLDYQPKNRLFIIKINEFEKDISAIVGQHIPVEETMNLLNIKNYEIKDKVKFKGSSLKCIKLNTYNLTYNLFDINIYDADELEELQIKEVENQNNDKETNENSQ